MFWRVRMNNVPGVVVCKVDSQLNVHSQDSHASLNNFLSDPKLWSIALEFFL